MLASSRYRDSTLAAALFAAALALSAGNAVARLKTSAPAGVDLSGAWQINLQFSEDPEEAQEEQRRQARERMKNVGSVAGPAVGGIIGVLVRALLGGVGNSDPAQQERAMLLYLMQTPDLFEIDQQAKVLTRKRPGGETDTWRARETEEVFLPDGSAAKRRCGWDGNAFIVELKLANGFARTDRYQLANDSNQLEVITEIKSPKGPRDSFKFKRVYDPIPAI